MRIFEIKYQKHAHARNFILSLICLFVFISDSYAQAKQEGWHLKKFESGIAVYTRDAENSAYKELKSIVSLKTSLESVVALINDFESYSGWVYRCGKSTTLKKINETESVHYQNVVAPWPVDNRDFIVQLKLTQDPLSKVVTINSTCKPDYIPKVPGHIRITEFRALWILTPNKDGTVEIKYQLLVNPGGYVPAWLVNLAVIDGPFETMVNFKQWVMKDKYQNAKLSYILD